MILRFLIEKEFKQMFRNIILPKVFLMLPLALICIMPFAATQEVKNLTVSIIDNDHSSWSGRLVNKLAASSYFNVVNISQSFEQSMKQVDAGDADFIVEIEPQFERHLTVEGISHVMITANAVNGVKAGLGSSYLSQIIADYSAQLRDESAMNALDVSMAHFDVSPRYLYNPSLDYKTFMIPGLIGMLLVLIVGFLPALNIVGEKEKGTIEQINVTPIGRFEFIFSKLIPYWCVGLVIMGYAMALAWAVYGIAPSGNIALIFLVATVFVLLVSCLGLIVSNYSGTMQQAAMVMFFFLIIFILLSGLLTPIASMPDWAKAITTVNPLRYFIEAMRTLYLKGSSFSQIAPNIIILAIYAATVWIWAIISYRKSN